LDIVSCEFPFLDRPVASILPKDRRVLEEKLWGRFKIKRALSGFYYFTKVGKVKNRIITFFFSAVLLHSIIGAAWAREHAPMTNQVNASVIQIAEADLLDLLRSHQFGVLDSRLNALQLNYEKDTQHEFAASGAFYWVVSADPELEGVLQQWVAEYPKSYAANLALGIYYMTMAAHWRGTKYFRETHPKRIENMDLYLEKAVMQLEKSLLMTEKPIISYTKLIGAACYRGDHDTADHWLTEALNHDPYCVTPRRAYMDTLEPRWGGSYEAMRKFAEDTRKGGGPKLEKAARVFGGWIHRDKGYQKYLEGNYVAALDEFEKAIAIEDFSWFRRTRAEIYQVVGQFDLAMADLNRALESDPQSIEGLYMRGITLLDKRQAAEALKDLHMAADHGDTKAVRKLGDLYTTGSLGVPLNVKEGMKWWKKAAYFWDEYACFSLGSAYEHGLGVQVDKATAVHYYRIAADQGYGPAINNLGLMLWYGQGTPANREEAIQLWIIGANKGIWQSKHNLQFFLSPLERLKLSYHYPWLFWDVKKIILLAIALILVLALVVIVFVRLARNRLKKRKGNYLKDSQNFI
jgi:TPR repeat protein